MSLPHWREAVPAMSGSLSPSTFKCQHSGCTIILSPKVTVSDKNGNKGRFFVSVCIITCLMVDLLMNYWLQCLGTLENPHTPFFRFVEDPRPSPPPQALPVQPALTNQTVLQPPVEQGRCAVSGCTKRRVNVKCPRYACATHCRALGGCPVNLHQSEGAALIPSSSSTSSQAAYQLPHSQLPPTTFSTTTPTFMPLCIPPLPPASISAIPAVTVPSHLPMQTVAEPRSLNPLPDPRFAPQMRPIFTSQSSREQEMRENVRAIDEQRLDGVKKVKHTVTVCAWLSVCLHSPFIGILLTIHFSRRTTMGLRNQFSKAGLSGPTSASPALFLPMPAFVLLMKIHGTIYTIVQGGHGNGSRSTISSLWILQRRSSSRVSM